MLKSVFTFYVFMLFLVKRSLSHDFQIAFIWNSFYKIFYDPKSFQESERACKEGKMNLHITTLNDINFINSLRLNNGIEIRQEVVFNLALNFSLIRVKNNSLNAIMQ